MKINWFNISLIGLLIGSLQACEIDTFPETSITEANFWVSEKDFQGAANQLYALLNAEQLEDMRADDINNGKTPDVVSAGTRVAPATSNDWTRPYNSIFVANRIIEHAPAISGELTPAEVKIMQYVSEARFFRCYYYFNLVKKFGDVPLMTRSAVDSRDPVLYTPRTSRDSIVRFIYRDLDSAIQYLPLPSTQGVAEYGRITKTAAWGLKARAGLYEGTRAKYHGYNENYKEHLKMSYEAAYEVIRSGQHGLYKNGATPYHEQFLYAGEGPANKENMLVKIYGYPDNIYITNNYPYDYYYRFGPTRNFLNCYLRSDGTPFIDNAGTEPSYNTYLENRDPRLAQTVMKNGETGYINSVFRPYQESKTAFGFKKYVPLNNILDNPSTVDITLMRYAEVLVSYAEAKYEYNGAISDEDLNLSINQLRDRVHFVHLTNSFVETHGLNMLEEIRRERSVELAFEGFRYDDIMRWKKAEELLPVELLGARYNADDWYSGADPGNIISRLNDEGVLIIESKDNRFFNPDRDYLYPIPYNDVANSRQTLKQNPNW
ncbi:RagB/SusD family nutrient uptake outer membrane protein [Niabella aurantiaca]|uniref:RagB/SusD family nutrient uptake outer membrane protein n=1 Tax=Niabella aurantiaca TaxID=379900 RepID=UPI000375D012|nr:RagB/SusD family nutrient uptake outer membrane protein [Niabella aurantiaca]